MAQVNRVRPTRSLSDMVYSGRGITIGMTPEGMPFVGYTLSGRSPPSKARRLEPESKGDLVIVSTRPTDESVLQKGNPALLVYPVIMANAQKIAISNGAQTALVLKAALPQALAYPTYINGIDVTSYEPDPSHTPRVTGELKRGPQGWKSVFHIVKKADDSDEPRRKVYHYRLEPGMARTMTTYAGGNESPLLPFSVAPMRTAITLNDPQELCAYLFSELRGSGAEDYRIATAVVTRTPAERGDAINVATLNAQVNQFHPRP